MDTSAAALLLVNAIPPKLSLAAEEEARDVADVGVEAITDADLEVEISRAVASGVETKDIFAADIGDVAKDVAALDPAADDFTAVVFIAAAAGNAAETEVFVCEAVGFSAEAATAEAMLP